jgi:hypothetical protein
MAHLLKDSLDGAAGQLRPVLQLPPDRRTSTVTGYTDEIGGMLPVQGFTGSPLPVRSRSRSRSSARARMMDP